MFQPSSFFRSFNLSIAVLALFLLLPASAYPGGTLAGVSGSSRCGDSGSGGITFGSGSGSGGVTYRSDPSRRSYDSDSGSCYYGSGSNCSYYYGRGNGWAYPPANPFPVASYENGYLAGYSSNSCYSSPSYSSNSFSSESCRTNPYPYRINPEPTYREFRHEQSPPASVAYVDINVPANARIQVEGVPMNQAGTTRRFVTPALRPGMAYQYELVITVPQNGPAKTLKHTLRLRGGDWEKLEVDASGIVRIVPTIVSRTSK